MNAVMELHIQQVTPDVLGRCLSNATSEQKRVLNFINSTFSFVLDEIGKRPCGRPRICLQRLISRDLAYDYDAESLVWKLNGREVVYEWPGKSNDEAWRFACVGRILVEIHRAIITGAVLTKRDIYYHDPVLFKNQDVVNRYIDDIAYTCKVTRSGLNVTASPRGLIVGLEPQRDVVNIVQIKTNDEQPTLLDHVKWILVVEKEATFQTLVDLAFHRSNKTALGLILTAKGYPDLATLRFLRDLTNRLDRDVPIYGLFDADPDGLDIQRCYSLGSRVVASENEFRILNIDWLGVKLCDVDCETYTPLTGRDRMKARSMLDRQDWYAPYSQVQEYRGMLQLMLMLNMKAEIQGIENRSGHFAVWLRQRMQLGGF